jgi:hypothetical protein
VPEATYSYARLKRHAVVERIVDDILIRCDSTFRIVQPTPFVRDVINSLSGAGGLRIASWPNSPSLRGVLGRLAEAKLIQTSDREFDSAAVSFLDTARDRTPERRMSEVGAVVLVGCGGIGGELARHLVASGLRALTLIDGDTVSNDNLNRQYLYGLGDVGNLKIEAGARALQLLALDRVDIQRLPLFVESRDQIEDVVRAAKEYHGTVEALICCADRPASIELTCLEVAFDTGLLYAAAGVGIRYGFWGPIVSQSQAHNRLARLRRQHRDSVAPPPAQSFGPTNSFVAAALANDLIHRLVGLGPTCEGERRIDFESYEVTIH